MDPIDSISIAVLLVVFMLIAIRRVGNVRLQIWQVMLGGAVVVLLTMRIPPVDALLSVNLDVMFFLLGMFIVGEALEQSGYLSVLASRFFSSAKDLDRLLLMVVFSMGLLSAILMNDTLAIIGTPLVIDISRRMRMKARPLLLALAFSVTTGSAMSPLGNPQNLLIAVGSGMGAPLIEFMRYLLVPTVLNLFVVYLVLRTMDRRTFGRPSKVRIAPGRISDPVLARLARASLMIIVSFLVLKAVLAFTLPELDLRLTYIALAAAAPIVILSKKRAAVLKGVDWKTLVFFASMFIVMAAVWRSGFFQWLLEEAGLGLVSTTTIFGVSIVLSQFLSNVPFVALFLPMMVESGGTTLHMIALASASTIAGNLTVLGAASNVIIIQNAEKRGETLGFMDFIRFGAPITVLNALVYIGWLALL